jgi:hypothetical protein
MVSLINVERALKRALSLSVVTDAITIQRGTLSTQARASGSKCMHLAHQSPARSAAHGAPS